MRRGAGEMLAVLPGKTGICSSPSAHPFFFLRVSPCVRFSFHAGVHELCEESRSFFVVPGAARVRLGACLPAATSFLPPVVLDKRKAKRTKSEQLKKKTEEPGRCGNSERKIEVLRGLNAHGPHFIHVTASQLADAAGARAFSPRSFSTGRRRLSRLSGVSQQGDVLRCHADSSGDPDCLTTVFFSLPRLRTRSVQAALTSRRMDRSPHGFCLSLSTLPLPRTPFPPLRNHILPHHSLGACRQR